MKLSELRETTKGKIFAVDFTKKDGSERHMVCRLGVTKGVTGQGMSYDPLSRGLLPVYDMQKHNFRMVNLNTVRKVKFQGKEFVVQDFNTETEWQERELVEVK